MSDSEQELDEIINKFNLPNFRNLRSEVKILKSNLNNMEPTVSMQTPPVAQVNYQLLRLYVDTIPNFDGNPHTLSIFINNCTSLINTFYRPEDEILNNFIVRAIIGKLTGRALSLIGSRINELNTWQDIKNALELSFGDQRNLDCLVQDLISLTPGKSETPYNFGMRCQDARSLIFTKLNSLNLQQNDRILRIRNYEELALKTFIRGLSGQLQNNIRLRDPDSLEKAMTLVIEEENFSYAQNRQNSINAQATFKPLNRMTPLNQNFNNNHQRPMTSNFVNNAVQQLPRQMSSFNPFRNTNNNNFMRPPNFQYQHQQPQFRTFQSQQPQFRPNFQMNNNKPPFFAQGCALPQFNRFNNNNQRQFNNQNNFPRNTNRQDEPMDTSSGNTRFQRPTQKFTSTELHQQDINPNINPSLDVNNTQVNQLEFSDLNPENYNETCFDYSDNNFTYADPTEMCNEYFPYQSAIENNQQEFSQCLPNENFSMTSPMKEKT